MDSRSLKAIDGYRREEHRKFMRFPLSLKAECHYNVRESGESCRIVDISSQGFGIELETPVKMVNGQLVLLSIQSGSRQPPVSAIAKLAWVQNQEDGFFIQRAGSLLLFMDPEEKERLLKQSHAGILSGIARGGISSPV